MTAFDDIKKQWESQAYPKTPENGSEKVIAKVSAIKKKQQITNVILSATALILIAFFFYISAYKVSRAMLGLFLMIGALGFRIVLEVMSIQRLKQLDRTLDAKNFKQQLISYYNRRVWVHGLATPLILAAYCVGFIILLPLFKENLSEGLYTYVWVSSIVLLLVFSIFIGIQIKRELHVLKKMKSETMEEDKNL